MLVSAIKKAHIYLVLFLPVPALVTIQSRVAGKRTAVGSVPSAGLAVQNVSGIDTIGAFWKGSFMGGARSAKESSTGLRPGLCNETLRSCN